MARAHHHFLDPVDPDRGERVAADLGGAADPARQGVVLMGNGDLVHIPPEGSIPHQLSQARSSANAATRDVQAAHEAGRRPMNDILTNGQTSDEAYRDEKSDAIDLYGE
jgi:hypothetical protein